MFCFYTRLLKELKKLESHKDLEPPSSVCDLNLRATADHKTHAPFWFVPKFAVRISSWQQHDMCKSQNTKYRKGAWGMMTL